MILYHSLNLTELPDHKIVWFGSSQSFHKNGSHLKI